MARDAFQEAAAFCQFPPTVRVYQATRCGFAWDMNACILLTLSVLLSSCSPLLRSKDVNLMTHVSSLTHTGMHRGSFVWESHAISRPYLWPNFWRALQGSPAEGRPRR